MSRTLSASRTLTLSSDTLVGTSSFIQYESAKIRLRLSSSLFIWANRPSHVASQDAYSYSIVWFCPYSFDKRGCRLNPQLLSNASQSFLASSTQLSARFITNDLLVPTEGIGSFPTAPSPKSIVGQSTLRNASPAVLFAAHRQSFRSSCESEKHIVPLCSDMNPFGL